MKIKNFTINLFFVESSSITKSSRESSPNIWNAVNENVPKMRSKLKEEFGLFRAEYATPKQVIGIDSKTRNFNKSFAIPIIMTTFGPRYSNTYK